MRTATGSQGMSNTHRIREPFPPSNDLQKTRSARNEAGKANCGPHALTQGEHSPARASHAPHKREPHRSVEWRPKLEEASDHERKASVDKHPTKAYRSGKKHIFTKYLSTSAIPTGKSLGIFLFAPTTTKQQKKRKTPASPDQNSGGSTTPQP